jgi:hypothetical protein
MLKTLKTLVFVIAAYLVCTMMISGSDCGTPLKYISSCELDLNGDGLSDVALLFETQRGRELLVLLRTDDDYEAHLISRKVPENMFLSCQCGKTIKGTSAGQGKDVERESQILHQTPGAYIKLYYPEGSSIAYFWNGRAFDELWLSD